MSDQLTRRGLNACFTSGLLTATGGVTTHDTTVTVTFCNNGKLSAVTAITTGATPTTDHITGAAFPALVGGASVANVPGQGAIVVWGFDTSNADAVVCMQGPIQALDMQGAFVKAPLCPPVPANVTVFAYQVLKSGATASTTAIIFGTANWNATGFTNVIVNVSVLPDVPQVD